MTRHLFTQVNAALIAVMTVVGCARRDMQQPTFATPESAVDALVAAAEKHDVAELQRRTAEIYAKYEGRDPLIQQFVAAVKAIK